MPLVKVLRSRGANIVVEANAEVLFAQTGDVGRWTNRFSQKVRAFAAQEAPTNKRPRWAHYGKPLKSTMRATTKYDPARMRVDSAVGSVARHGYYVDQGTGVFAGNAPYKAKILPPWTRGDGTLYEHTWRAGGPGPQGTTNRWGNPRRTARPVMIKGQKGQGFLDAGVRRGFTAMRLLDTATGGAAKMTEALSSFPSGLEGFAGNTQADAAFIAQLTEWRAWRDAAWKIERESTKARNRARRENMAAIKAAAKANKPTKPKKPPRKRGPNRAALAQDRAKFLAAMMKKYGAGNVERGTLEYKDGYWYITVRVTGDNGRPEYKEVRAKSKVAT